MSKSPSPPAPAQPTSQKSGKPKRGWRRPVAVASLAVLAAGLLVWWFLVPHLSASRQWRAAMTALDADDFPAARRALLDCQAAWPRSPDVALALARLERRSGDPRKARDLLEEARRMGCAADRADFEQLLLQAQAGGVRAAEARLTAAVGGNLPDASLACEALVKGYLQTNDRARAHLTCDTWVGRHPGDWRGHLWMGTVLQMEGYTALAAEEFRAATEANPANAGVRFRFADALVALSEFPRALPYLELCRDANPDDPNVRFSLARCLHALGKGEEAEAYAESLVLENPAHGPALLLLARIRLGREDAAGALKYARRAAELSPGDAVVAGTLAEALRGVQSDQEAAAWEEKARAITEQNDRLATLTRDMNYHPRDVGVRYELGTLLLRLGRKEEAIRCWRSALAIDKDHKPTLDALRSLAGPADARPGPPAPPR
jgi:tetratricopeptide (TPR) repeat protein